MTRYVCNFVPMYKTYIETKHKNVVTVSVHWKWDRLVTYWLILVSKYFEPLRSNGVHKNLANKFVQGRELKKEQSKSCPSCMRHSYLTWYMCLPNIMKLPKKVWELWAAQALGFRGDKYLTKKVVSFARDTPTVLNLCIYQILIKYFKPLRSYGVHRNLA